MRSGNPNKEISKVIRERLANGEKKADIFKYLQTQFGNDDLSARILAVSPYPDQCQKCRKLNHVLIATIVAVTIAKVLFAGLLILSEIPKSIPLLLIVPLLNIYLIYLVAKFNILGYGLIVALGVLGLGNMVVELGNSPSLVNVIITAAISFLILAGIILAAVLCRRLLPNSTFFLRPRKNEAGEYIF